ncbi:MAG TPA: TetR/AcrR family transcriptional regulator [Solirubrobacterales bacterium]|jgi:AcrR family transcriptional regulator
MKAPERISGQALRIHPIAKELFSATRERGYATVGVEELLERSGMSRAEFDDNFEGKTDLVARVLEALTEDIRERVGRAFDSVLVWPDNLRAAAYESARWILANPGAVWFVMVGALGAPDAVLLRREEMFKWGVRMIDAGRARAPDPQAVPVAAPVMAVGAIAETVRRQQEGSVEEDIVGAVANMMAAAVRPYLGAEAARRELTIPPPADLS